jgi:hypothetical protein
MLLTPPYHHGGHPDFDAREVTLLHRIIPHLSSGLKAAVLCKEASAKPEGESAPGVLILDDRGQVVQHTQAAERWLRNLDDLAEDWLEGEGHPAPVWMVVGALRKAIKPQTDRDLNGAPSFRSRHVRAAGSPFTARGPSHDPAAGTRRWSSSNRPDPRNSRGSELPHMA